MVPVKAGLAQSIGRLRQRTLYAANLRELENLRDKRWKVYRDLKRESVALAGIRCTARVPKVNLVLPELDEKALFAGIRTALVFGGNIAMGREQGLRILYFGRPLGLSKENETARSVAQISGLRPERIELASAWTLAGRAFSQDDLWIATHWITAHALAVGVALDLVDPRRVIYLVQDYEPEFYSGSTESALCQSTYNQGFRLVVNSYPVCIYLEQRENLQVDRRLVFRPELDLEALSRSAEMRRQSPRIRIAFYGRPSKPRNAFVLGVSAVRAARALLEDQGVPAEFVSVGERHPRVPIGDGRFMYSVGKLAWSGYFDFLAKTDVILSLQQTPHPSHPPLDAVASGAFAVTNEYGGTRNGLSDRLIATTPDPVTLASAIAGASRSVQAGGQPQALDTPFVERLGRPLNEVIRTLLSLT